MHSVKLAALTVLLSASFLRAQQDTGDLAKRVAGLEAAVKQLTKELQELRAQLKTPASKDATILRLKHASASTMAKTLGAVFALKKDGTLRIVHDERTNTLIIQGSDADVQTIKALVQVLDEPAAEQGTRARPGAGDEKRDIEEALRLLRKAEEQTNKVLEREIARSLLRPLGQPGGDLKQRLELAESEAEMCRERAAWCERMHKKGFIGDTQLRADRERLKRAEEQLAALRKEATEKKPK